MKDRTATSAASTEIRDKTAIEPARELRTLSHWRGFLVLLPGLCTLILWEIAAWQWPGVARLVSQPIEIARGIVDVVTTGVIWQHLDATLKEMAVGYVIGAITGVALGFLCGRMKLLGDILNPYITLFNGIPKVALAPVFVIWFGIGLMSKIAIILTMVFFVVFINTFAGLRSVNEDYVAIVRIMGASRWQVVREVFLPGTLPFIIVGLRAGIPFSVIGAVVGEFIASTKGLGFFINYNQGAYDTNGIFVGVTILAILVVVLDGLLSLVERRLLKWRPEVEAKNVGA
jgi:NitT/TauT family transport system permease protein